MNSGGGKVDFQHLYSSSGSSQSSEKSNLKLWYIALLLIAYWMSIVLSGLASQKINPLSHLQLQHFFHRMFLGKEIMKIVHAKTCL